MHNTSLESLHAAIPPHLLPCNGGLNGTGPPVPSPVRFYLRYYLFYSVIVIII